MKRFSPGDYPQLTRFVRGYLHQDFVAVDGSPAGALDAFLRDATPEQTHALSAELCAFMAAIEDVKFDQAQKWWTSDLGSDWLPQDKDELAALCGRLSGPKK